MNRLIVCIIDENNFRFRHSYKAGERKLTILECK